MLCKFPTLTENGTIFHAKLHSGAFVQRGKERIADAADLLHLRFSLLPSIFAFNIP